MDKLSLRTVAALALTSVFSLAAYAQQPAASPTPPPAPQPSPEAISAAKVASGDLTADQVAELSIAIYGFPNGRTTLTQIRKTATERGKITLTDTTGKTTPVTYQRWFTRPDTGSEKTRIDQQLPNAKFSLIHDGNELFGVFNDSAFVPRDDASQGLQNQLNHSIDALLRYKEAGSALATVGREKILGVDYHIIDLTDKSGRKTRYYISAKSFRVMMLDYESAGVKYRRKFYDYRYAQGTLVPYRSVLLSGDKVVEEQSVGTVTYGQKIDEGLFIKP